MSNDNFAKYDADRNFSNKGFRSACYAPYSSMYFDQLGFVRACCQNAQHNLGNLTQMTLDEIWNGVRVRMLRDALRRYDFSLGCQYCEWQVREGNSNNFARIFDRWSVESTDDIWPSQFEFSISNTCNLECVMCNGEWSSSIRTRREKLPPLKKVYGDQFFDDLRKYLPHLKELRMLGGEPFLAAESYRIWNMLIEDNLTVDCHVTTNGTQYNDKVERVLKHLPFSITMSMDGATRDTVEKVRKNANYDVVMANLKRFREYTRERGTSFGLTYCLIPLNWHEFGDYLLLADELDCNVYVNTVVHPPEHSFFTMSSDQLRPFVEGLEAQGDRVLPLLKRNKQAWIQEFERLKNRCTHADQDFLTFVPGRLFNETPSSSLAVIQVSEDSIIDEARRTLTHWSEGGSVTGFTCDRDDRVTDTLEGMQDFAGIERSACIGRPFDQIYPLLRGQYGVITGVHRERRGDFIDRYLGFQDNNLTERTLRLLTFNRSSGNDPTGSITLGALISRPFHVVRAMTPDPVAATPKS